MSDCGYARDLDAPPAMMLNDSIFLRTEALRRWLWERYEEWTWNKRNAAMGRSLACYDFAGDKDQALELDKAMAMLALHREQGDAAGKAIEALLEAAH